MRDIELLTFYTAVVALVAAVVAFVCDVEALMIMSCVVAISAGFCLYLVERFHA